MGSPQSLVEVLGIGVGDGLHEELETLFKKAVDDVLVQLLRPKVKLVHRRYNSVNLGPTWSAIKIPRKIHCSISRKNLVKHR